MFKQILIYLLISVGLTTTVFASEPVDEKKLAIEVNEFIDMMVDEHAFDREYLEKWFASAKPNKPILKTIARPAESTMTWHRYRKIFIQQERVDKGLAFWKEHEETLARAEAKYGVPAEVILGLIGVETKYGRIKGKIDVFDSLYTLGFHFPRRSKFFRKELKEFLLLAREQEWTIGTINGSYAGAMGYGQFMPSSYRMYAVDFDDDGKIDLLNNPVDAIGSVANYVKVHGWEVDGGLVYKADVKGEKYKTLKTKGLKPKSTIEQFSQANVTVKEQLSPEMKAVLVELQQKDHKEYWLGLHNFYVISRYNPRAMYTMAVIQLTEMIKEQRFATTSGEAK